MLSIMLELTLGPAVPVTACASASGRGGLEDAGEQVHRLANGGGEGGAYHRLRLLLDDGDQRFHMICRWMGGELCRRGPGCRRGR